MASWGDHLTMGNLTVSNQIRHKFRRSDTVDSYLRAIRKVFS